MKNCPSCKATPEIIKDGNHRYIHLPNCEVGKMSFNPQCPKSMIMCNKCFATASLEQPSIAHNEENSKSYSLECPFCWALYEVINK